MLGTVLVHMDWDYKRQESRIPLIYLIHYTMYKIFNEKWSWKSFQKWEKFIKTFKWYLRRTLASETNFGNWNPFKNLWKLLFISPWKLFSVSWYLNFFLDFLVNVEKWLDYKDKFSFKICNVTTCEKNNFNTHVDQYLKK